MKCAIVKAIGEDDSYSGINHKILALLGDGKIRNPSGKWLSEHKDIFKIAFVRHPTDRIISCYTNKVRGIFHEPFRRDFAIQPHWSFDRFMELVADVPDERADQHFRSQYAELYHRGELIPDFVGRVETLEYDWARLRRYLWRTRQFELGPLPHVNASYVARERCSKYAMELIRIRYWRDFEAFGYDPNQDL